MVKILYVIENIFFGGGERAFVQIISGLDGQEYEIYIACAPGGEFVEKIKNSAKILDFSLRNRFSIERIRQLVNIIKENNIQIVHSQGGRADFFARVAARRAKTPAAVSTVAMPVEGYNVGLLSKAIYVILDRFSERYVDKFIVVSEALKKSLIKKHNISQEKVIQISNGIELEQYYSKPEWVNKIRNEFSIKSDVRLVGTIGRLVWQKGLGYFLQAVKEIETRSNIKNAKYLIVGEGKDHDNLEQKAKELGIRDKVIFTGFRQDIKEILCALDILILPSIREGQPIILLEAMAMGKPVIATDIQGVNETVLNGITGMLVPAKSYLALAKAIINLLKDNKKAQEMGEMGRKLVEEKFNLKDKIKQHEQLYQAVIAERAEALTKIN